MQKLLLIEDNEDLCLLWNKYFSNAGFEVTVCNDAACGLAALAEDDFALIICDYVLPDLTGTELLDRAREIRPKVPFVLLTGMRESEIKAHVAAAGRSIVVHKPIAMMDLLAKVEALMAQSYEATKP